MEKEIDCAFSAEFSAKLQVKEPFEYGIVVDSHKNPTDQVEKNEGDGWIASAIPGWFGDNEPLWPGFFLLKCYFLF